MKWAKKGMIYRPKDHGLDWMRRRPQTPFTLLFDDFIRVYFNVRAEREPNGMDRSRPAFADFDRKNFPKLLRVSQKPLFELGGKGTFDEFGAMANGIIKMKDKYHLYYGGWTRMSSVPYNWAIGLAYSSDGESFVKAGTGPVIGATVNEPFLQGGAALLHREGELHIWYFTGVEWLEREEGADEAVYRIVHASSKDGIGWKRDGKFLVEPVVEHEAQSAPKVFKIKDKWHMIFSYRHGLDFRNKERGYRVGHAVSDDLVTWKREDETIGIDISETGWDSEMICYPHVFEMDGKMYMIYCGNDFGEEGFGYAVLEEE